MQFWWAISQEKVVQFLFQTAAECRGREAVPRNQSETMSATGYHVSDYVLVILIELTQHACVTNMNKPKFRLRASLHVGRSRDLAGRPDIGRGEGSEVSFRKVPSYPGVMAESFALAFASVFSSAHPSAASTVTPSPHQRVLCQTPPITIHPEDVLATLQALDLRLCSRQERMCLIELLARPLGFKRDWRWHLVITSSLGSN